MYINSFLGFLLQEGKQGNQLFSSRNPDTIEDNRFLGLLLVNSIELNHVILGALDLEPAASFSKSPMCCKTTATSFQAL